MDIDNLNCNCDHEHDEMETMTLTLDDDTELECGIIGVFEVEDKEYIALLPVDDETVLIYEYSENGEEIELGLIEDDIVFEKVSNTFYDLWEEEDSEELEETE
ncbi:MAG: DUF1292 domain-containing protein [Firmicutes bacterium]|nr:DUF1292 domain-containing protein [Bacillota bacterium]